MPPTAHFLCLLAACSAFMASLALTGLVRHLARRYGFVDRPDGGRKLQKQAVALGGGIAVAVATLIGVGVVVLAGWLRGYTLPAEFGQPLRLALLVAAVLIVLLGLIDDVVAMKGRYKLLGQVLISGLLIAAGLRIEMIHAFGHSMTLDWLSGPLTLFWLLGAINAINLIDGIDGLAGSVGVVLCLTVAAITFLQGLLPDAVIMVALAGGLIGFLRYNFAPATIYLGDAGSMLVGLVIGVIAIPGNAKSQLAVGMMVPVAVWAIPILDSAAAILRRKLTGQSLFAPDRGHLHHSLLSRGWSVRQASMFIALICATTCVGAVLSVIWRTDVIAMITVFVVILYLVQTRTFGHIEVALMANRYQPAGAGPGGGAANVSGRQHAIQLQGSREWGKLWAAITEGADDHRLSQVRLSINIPALNEVFYAKWDSTQHTADEDRKWRVTQPLSIDGEAVGSLELAGLPPEGGRPTPAQVREALDFLEPIEEDIRQIRERIRGERPECKVGRSGAPAESPLPPAAGQTNAPT